MRLAHFADLHLGAGLTGFTVDAPASLGAVSLADAPFEAFRDAALLVASSGYDGVVIAGDVFDRGEVLPRALTIFQEALDTWVSAGLAVAIIGGNHDAESSARCALPRNVHWMAADAPETIVWERCGVAIHGQSVGEKDDLRDLVPGYPRPLPDLVNIGLLHTSLDGARSRRACIPTALDALRAHDYDYWALGHVHEQIVLDERIAFSGSVFARRPDETGAHGFLDVRLEGTEITLLPVNTARVRWEWLDAALSDDAIRARFLDPAVTEDAVIWSIRGEVSPLDLVRVQSLAADHPGFLVQRAP